MSSIWRGPEWSFARERERFAVRLNPHIVVNTNDGALEATKLGYGLTRLISYQVSNEIQAGAIKTVLSDFDDAVRPVHVIFREGRHGSAKVRSFVDLAVETLRANNDLQ